MYELELKYEDPLHKVKAIKTVSSYFGITLKDAKFKVEQEMSNQYFKAKLNLSEHQLQEFVYEMTSSGFDIRNVKNLNEKLDVSYVYKVFGHMWKDDIDQYVLEKLDENKYLIWVKRPLRICLIEDNLVYRFILDEMLKAGVEISDKPLQSSSLD